MVIIILIKLLFPGDVALWLPKSLLPQPRSGRNSCMACFAMVFGKAEQNVRRREQELKAKGNVKTNGILFQWHAGPRLCCWRWSLALSISLLASDTLYRDFLKLGVILGSGNTYANFPYHQGKITGSTGQTFSMSKSYMPAYHVKRVRCLYGSSCGHSAVKGPGR